MVDELEISIDLQQLPSRNGHHVKVSPEVNETKNSSSGGGIETNNVKRWLHRILAVVLTVALVIYLIFAAIHDFAKATPVIISVIVVAVTIFYQKILHSWMMGKNFQSFDAPEKLWNRFAKSSQKRFLVAGYDILKFQLIDP